MSSRTMVTDRFMAFLPAAGVSLREGAAARVIRYAESHGYDISVREPYVVVSRNVSDAPRFSDSPGLLLDVFTGTAISEVSVEVAAHPFTLSSLEEYATGKVQFYNLIEITPDSFQLLSDPLGLKPYYAVEAEGGLALCSSFRDIVRCFPQALKPADELGILEFLVVGAPHAARTLHRKIERPACGTRIQWTTRQGVRRERSRRVPLPEVNASIGTTRAIELIGNSFQDSIRKFAGNAPKVIVPITGGFDSRLIACESSALNLPLQTSCIGFSFHSEAQVARRIAGILGLPYELVQPRRSILDMLDLWLETMEGEVDTHTVFVAHLFDLHHPAGTPLMHGFIGDALSGAHLSWVTNDQAERRDQLPDGVMASLVGPVNPKLGEILKLSASLEELWRAIRGEITEEGHPYQALMLWDLENRQRRHVASALSYLGRQYRIGAPNYNPTVLKLWLSMPKIALDGRTLLRQLYRHRFPKIAGIPHSEESIESIPTNIPALTYAIRRYSQKFGSRIWNRLSKPRYPSDRSYIWTLWHGTTEKERSGMMLQLPSRLEKMQTILGWRPPELTTSLIESFSSRPLRQNLCLRRLFLLSAYCEWLERDLPPRVEIIDRRQKFS